MPGRFAEPMDHQSRNLVDAARRGNAVEVRSHLAAGASADASDEDGRTPAHIACAAGFVEVLRALIDAPADLDLRDDFGSAPVHVAALHGHADCLRLVLETGVDVDDPDRDGRTPLHEAVEGIGQGAGARCLQVLIDCGANVNASNRWEQGALAVAVTEIADPAQRQSALRRLLDAGAASDSVDRGRRSALHHAARSGCAGTVALLLKAGGDPNRADSEPRTPLHNGVASENIEVIERLLRAGADPNGRDGMSVTPLHLAAETGNAAVVDRLLGAGAAPTGDVLHWAIRGERAEVVDRLINAGAKTLRTLHAAAEGGQVDIVDRLIDAGEDLWREDLENLTPRDCAANAAVRERLRQAMVNSNPAPLRRSFPPGGARGLAKQLVSEGISSPLLPAGDPQPLHGAVEAQSVEVVQLLLEFGAEVSSDRVVDSWADDRILPLVRRQWPRLAAYWRGRDREGEPRLRALTRFMLGYSDPRNGIRWSQWTQQEAMQWVQNNPDRVNAHYVDAMTPLHFAAANDMPEVVSRMIDLGAWLQKTNHMSQTPLHVAAQSAGYETVRRLVEAGARLEYGTRRESPLHVAAKSGNASAARALLEAGADVTARYRPP